MKNITFLTYTFILLISCLKADASFPWWIGLTIPATKTLAMQVDRLTEEETTELSKTTDVYVDEYAINSKNRFLTTSFIMGAMQLQAFMKQESDQFNCYFAANCFFTALYTQKILSNRAHNKLIRQELTFRELLAEQEVKTMTLSAQQELKMMNELKKQELNMIDQLKKNQRMVEATSAAEIEKVQNIIQEVYHCDMQQLVDQLGSENKAMRFQIVEMQDRLAVECDRNASNEHLKFFLTNYAKQEMKKIKDSHVSQKSLTDSVEDQAYDSYNLSNIEGID